MLGLIETEERSEAYESEEEMTDETEIQEIQAEPLTEQAAGDFLIQGVTEEIQSSFLKVEMDFRYLVEYRAENIHTAPLDTVTFLEELYKTEKEISWRIQLLFLMARHMKWQLPITLPRAIPGWRNWKTIPTGEKKNPRWKHIFPRCIQK